jgi:hypothetical protein
VRIAAFTGLVLMALPAAAEEPFSYDTVRPGSQFHYNTIEPGRDLTPGGTLSGTEYYGQGGPLGNTEGPGVPMEPPGGYSGTDSLIDCGPGARYLDEVTGDRLRRLNPQACGGAGRN